MIAPFSYFKMSLDALIGTLTTVVLAVLGWAFNINTKVNVTQQQNQDLRELIESKFDLMLKRFDDFDGRLGRIERHIDGEPVEN